MRRVVAMMILISAGLARAATVEGNVSAQSLLNWFNKARTVSANVAVRANGKDMNHGGTGFCLQCSNDASRPTAAPKTVSLYQTGGADFFEADMDIDCDGSNSGVCGGTDPSHQNLLSCDDNARCSKDNHGPIDANGTPFYVIPEGSPFKYTSRGINIGQLAVIINTKTRPMSIIYAPFLDADGVSQEIGEASAAAAKLLGVPNNPNTGGQGSGIVYIIFRGSAGRLTSVTDWANHKKAISVGQSLAAKLLSSNGVQAFAADGVDQQALDPALPDYSLNVNSISFNAEGSHSLSILTLNGQKVMGFSGTGAQEYDFSGLKPGLYLLMGSTPNGSFSEKFIRH